MDTARRQNPFEPLARAYQRAVPEHSRDDGLFGPRSIVWRVNRDRSFPLAGMRSLMVQALHPLAMAGVAEHSNWRQDPFGRLAATSGYVLTTTYGDTESALAAAAWVRKIHVHVRGVDPETKLPYSAEDPSLLLWVHAGMVDSIIDVVQRYGRALDPVDADRYVAQMVRFAEIVGVPREDVPATVASLRAYIDSVELRRATPAAQDAMALYASVFPGARMERIERYGPGEAGPSGTVKVAHFDLNGHRLMFSDSYVKHAAEQSF